MEAGDIVYTHDENWIIMQILYTDEYFTYVLAIQEDADFPVKPSIIKFQV